MWYTAAQVSVINGGLIVTVNSGEDISTIQPHDGLIIGSFNPVEIKKAYVDGDNNKFIELQVAWDNSTQNTVPARVQPLPANLAAATKALSSATQITSDNFKVQDEWGTKTGNVEFTGADGAKHSARTMQQMDNDVQGLQDNNQTIIDDSVSASLAKIRYSKLDNPLCHLFKKNKLVDTLSGALSWTRASGATYIDRYGKLQYSPSPNATNLALWSEDFSNAAWTLNGSSTVTANVHKSLGLSVNELNGTEADYDIRQSVTLPATPTTVTVSLFFEKGSAEITLLGAKSGASGFYAMTFNMLTGQVTNLTADAGDVEDLGDTYRAWFTYTTDGTAIFSQVRIKTDLATVYVTGMQVEKSKVANGYVKTETTSKTGTNNLGIEQARQEKQGWLIEGVSTNLLLHSEDGTKAAWSKNGLAVTKSIDSRFGATQVITQSDDTTSNIFYQGSVPLTDTTVTMSARVRPEPNRDRVRVVINRAKFVSDNNNAGAGGLFLFTTGVASVMGGLCHGHTVSMIDEGDGWWLISMTCDVFSASTQQGNVHLYFDDPSLIDDGATIATLQLEALPSVSSYIPTTDSATTRAAQPFSMPSNGNVSSGDISIHSRIKLSKGSTDTTLWGYDSGNSAIRLLYSTGGKLRFFTKNNGAFTNSLDSNVIVPGWYTVTVVISDVVTIYLDGIAVVSGVTQDRTSDITREFSLGGSTGRVMYSDFRIYDFALNSDEVSFLAGE